MPDYEDMVTRTAVDSDIVRTYPGAHVQIFEAETTTLVWEGIADEKGHWSVTTLDSGKYDIKVDGQTVRTIHHVKADHVHTPDEIWTMTRHGSITATLNENNNCAVFVAPAAAWSA